MTQTHIVLYTTPEGEVKVDTVLQDKTLWLTQDTMAELFGVQRPAITKHIKNIFESDELSELVVSSILEHTTDHGAIQGKTQTRAVKYYNLDAIIAVGYRVNSRRATQFRIWATNVLKEYIVKGFAMDDERLKNAEKWDYFDEWLERIRDIRASEKRFYQKILGYLCYRHRLRQGLGTGTGVLQEGAEQDALGHHRQDRR